MKRLELIELSFEKWKVWVRLDYHGINLIFLELVEDGDESWFVQVEWEWVSVLTNDLGLCENGFEFHHVVEQLLDILNAIHQIYFQYFALLLNLRLILS